jgi:hypothetical protein
MAFYLEVDAGRGRVGGLDEDTPAQRATRRSLIQWATSISTSFQHYLGREILIAEREEYFDVPGNGQSYFVRGVPIVEILRVQNDPTGQFTGSEWTLTAGTDYYPGETGTYLQIWVNMLIGGSRFLRVKYRGGMAHHPVNSKYLVSAEETPASIQAGRYVYGNSSESQGKIISYDADTHLLVVEAIVGIFTPGETLTFQASQGGQDIPDTSAVLDEVREWSVAERFPDLDQALLIELRYMQKTQMTFENTSSGGPMGSSYRHTVGDRRAVLFQPETLAILNRYRRVLVGN